MAFKIIFAGRALADLEELVEEPDHPGSPARRLLMGILRDINGLRDAPRKAGILPRQADLDYRQLTHHPYQIVYEVSDRDRTVTVYRVSHVSRGTPQF